MSWHRGTDREETMCIARQASSAQGAETIVAQRKPVRPLGDERAPRWVCHSTQATLKALHNPRARRAAARPKRILSHAFSVPRRSGPLDLGRRGASRRLPPWRLPAPAAHLPQATIVSALRAEDRTDRVQARSRCIRLECYARTYLDSSVMRRLPQHVASGIMLAVEAREVTVSSPFQPKGLDGKPDRG